MSQYNFIKQLCTHTNNWKVKLTCLNLLEKYERRLIAGTIKSA